MTTLCRRREATPVACCAVRAGASSSGLTEAARGAVAREALLPAGGGGRATPRALRVAPSARARARRSAAVDGGARRWCAAEPGGGLRYSARAGATKIGRRMAAVPAVAPAEAAGEPAGERVRKLLEIERLLARAEEGCVRRCDVSNAAAQLQAIRDEIDGELPAATNGSEGAPCPHDNVHEEMHRIVSASSRPPRA